LNCSHPRLTLTPTGRPRSRRQTASPECVKISSNGIGARYKSSSENNGFPIGERAVASAGARS